MSTQTRAFNRTAKNFSHRLHRLNLSHYSNTISLDKPNLYYQPSIDTLHTLNSKHDSNLRFNDKIRISCNGGNGGQGCVSFESHSRRRGKPDGGSGGIGGNVIIECIDAIGGFSFSKRSFRASNGGNGYDNKREGSKGKDYTLKVPMGTVVKQLGIYRTYDRTETNHIFEDNRCVLKELLQSGESICVAKGGNGGKGNLRLRSQSNNHPRWSEMGENGEQVLLELELKSIADIGFVGYPNAGKSTLLTQISNAKPCVSSLPFTTLNPHIGHVRTENGIFSIADIPGIIEGAHEDKGLGLQFLKHIERCKVLIYILDIVGTDNRCPIEDFNKLRHELHCYNPRLISDKPSIIFANKCDIMSDFETLYEGQLDIFGFENKNELMQCVNDRIERLKGIVSSDGIPVIKGSAVKREIEDLLVLCQDRIRQFETVESTKQREMSEPNCAGSSDEDMPHWGKVQWFDGGCEEGLDRIEFADCNTKIEHQSAAKQYYEKFDTNRIYRFEDQFQQTTKHTTTAPMVEYESFKFESEYETVKQAQVVHKQENNGEQELASMFNIDKKYGKNKTYRSKIDNLKNLR